MDIALPPRWSCRELIGGGVAGEAEQAAVCCGAVPRDILRQHPELACPDDRRRADGALRRYHRYRLDVGIGSQIRRVLARILDQPFSVLQRLAQPTGLP